MFEDGPRRQGRFIKRGSRVADKVDVVDFVFREMAKTPTITHDNAARTIVHAKYHLPDEVEESVRPPETFNDDLQPGMQRRTVILPMDFTKDWERDKKLRKDRSMRSDEDLDFEFDQALGSPPDEDEEEEAQASAAGKAVAEIQAAATAQAEEIAAEQTKQDKKKAAQTVTAAARPDQEQHFASIDAVGAAIKSLMGNQPVEPAGGAGVNLKGQDAFVPIGSPSQNPVDVEARAAEEYKQRQAQQKAFEAEMQQKAEEAKAQGYRDGYRLGEEKAELAARQHAAQVFGKVSELIGEFSNLKKEILSNVQENFYELSQAIAEALTQREFSVNPATFTAVLQRAIDEAVQGDSFKIRVHPDMYDRIASLGAGEVKELMPSLVKDAEIEPFDFRIESSLSVVDANVRKMIKDLLDKADLQLFEKEDEEKAS